MYGPERIENAGREDNAALRGQGRGRGSQAIHERP
jgi:hypothetical protein